MNITEATAVNHLLRSLGVAGGTPDPDAARKAASVLAGRASKALAAGISSNDVLVTPAFNAGRNVLLSDEAYTVLCGLIAPNWLTCDEPDAVNHGGIYSEKWDELRAAFPTEHFHQAVRDQRYGEDFYDEEAGL